MCCDDAQNPPFFIARTVWRAALLNATFSAGALVIGLVPHVMMSVMLGIVLILAVSAARFLRRNPGLLAPTEMVFGLLVGRSCSTGFGGSYTQLRPGPSPAWVLAVGHLMYGAVTALIVGTAAAARRAAARRAAA